MKYLYYIAFLFILTSCGGSDEAIKDENVYEIRDVGKLSTTEFTIGKIVKLDDTEAEWYKYGDRKILISTKAKVKAGVDLSKIKDEDIKVKGNTIEIKLPPAEITTFTMDPRYTHTEMESINGFRDKFTQKEKNSFLKQGEEAIKKELPNTGILDDAEKNAVAFIENFYKQLGFENVIVQKTSRE